MLYRFSAGEGKCLSYTENQNENAVGLSFLRLTRFFGVLAMAYFRDAKATPMQE